MMILKFYGCHITHLLDITLPERQGTDLLLKVAQQSDVILRKMVPSIQSLEDVFVKLIKEDDHAHL